MSLSLYRFFLTVHLQFFLSRPGSLPNPSNSQLILSTAYIDLILIRKETQRFDKSHICPDHPCYATLTKVVKWVGSRM